MQRIWRHRFRRTTIWLVVFISLLCGLGLARTGSGPTFDTVIVAAILLALSFKRCSWLTLVLALATGLALGWWRGNVYMQKLAAYNLLYDQKIALTAHANDDAVYNRFKSLSFNARDVTLANGQKLVGNIELSGFGVNAVYQDDEVVATGKLRPGFGSYQASMGFAQLRVTSRHPTIIANIKRRFIAGAQAALPEPLASFVMGLLVGQRATLPDSVKDDFKKVGLTHIVAVSGANLTIILQAVRRLLGKRSKRMSTGLTLALIGTFLLLTGFGASIVRAAIVSLLSIAAGYYGRSFRPLNLIALAAVITAMANPIYIWSDLGWWLSFLAFYGVLVLEPLIQNRWPGRWHNNIIIGVALESICAEIMALPFVLFIFGQMSRVGLLANVLVVAFIPLAMLLGTIDGLAGMLLGSFSGWFSWPAVLVLNYMLDVAHILANVPGSFVEGIGLSLAQMIITYICICTITAILWFKNSRKNVTITDMNKTKAKELLA